MRYLDWERLVLNIFNEDKKKNNGYTDITHICVNTIKSLIPSMQGNNIDYKRFHEELSLWKYYGNRDNDSIINIVSSFNREDYYSLNDDTIYSRLIPIIVANDNYDNIESEIIKNILFTNGNLKMLIQWLFISRVIYMSIKKVDNIIDDLKEYIMNIDQNEYLLKYKDFYRIDLDEYPGNFNIEFEKEKIQYLTILNGICVKGYEMPYEIIKIIKKDIDLADIEFDIGRIIYNSELYNESDINIHKFYINMNEYIIRLRKGSIPSKDLIIKDYKLPNIFEFDKGEKFFHSLLGNCKVIKKEVRNNILTSTVNTKTGVYVFKQDPI